jgi:hypothetical protein
VMPSWQRRAHEFYYYNLERKQVEFSGSVHVFASSSLSVPCEGTFDALKLPSVAYGVKEVFVW